MMPVSVFPAGGKAAPVIILVVLAVVAMAMFVDKQATPAKPAQPKS
jgi:hypothetical protein